MKLNIGKIIACGAIALAGLGLSTPTACAAFGTINNDTWLRSTDGQPVIAHSGYLVKFGSTYYLYGQQYSGSLPYYQTGNAGTDGAQHVSTNVYTSTDLIHWTPKVVAWDGGNYVQTDDWAGRCWGVLFNAATNRYVMWMKYQGVNGFGGLCLTATSPLGPFTVDHLQTSVANIFSTPPICGDSKFFYAADGTPYLACSDSHGRQRAYVAPLSSDYKTINPVVQIATWPEGQEGNTALYAPTTNRYYYFTSETNGWSYSHAFVVNSTSVSSGYTGRVILPGTEATNTYWSQTVQAVKVPGTSGTVYLMLCDRWGLFSANYANAGHGTGYNVLAPLTLSGAKATFNPLATWQLDAAAGTWQSGSAPGPVTYQAESATLGGGTASESSSAGFHGTGYVNFPTTGGTCQFNNASGVGGGAKTLVIRFALLSGLRTGTLTINGVNQNITFNSTGAWTTWATMNVAVTLNSGTTNTIRFTSTGQDLANLDEITIQ